MQYLCFYLVIAFYFEQVYTQEWVSFIKTKINEPKFKENEDENNILTNMARRIYAIRNALVHSKEIFENRFKPFDDENELINEIPLIHLIAEEIILNSGEKIDLL